MSLKYVPSFVTHGICTACRMAQCLPNLWLYGQGHWLMSEWRFQTKLWLKYPCHQERKEPISNTPHPCRRGNRRRKSQYTPATSSSIINHENHPLACAEWSDILIDFHIQIFISDETDDLYCWLHLLIMCQEIERQELSHKLPVPRRQRRVAAEGSCGHCQP